jgi:ABC-2 type transport system ATP-binding protein
VLLKELSRMGKTILISSHILTELSDLCTAVAILEKGRVVESGSTARIQEKHTGSRRVRVRLHVPHAPIVELLAAHPDVRDVTTEGREASFEFLGEPEKFHQVVKVLADAEVPMLSIEQETSDLESLFMELTQGDVQ